jgi:hypothetical protein
MSNRCRIIIYLVGSTNVIAEAERDLKQIFSRIWEDAEAENCTHVPRKKMNEHQWRTNPPAYGYYLWYPWRPPVEALDQLAADNPNVLMAVMFDESGVGFRGQRFYADGVVQSWHQGSFGPDGHEFYDEISPLPDFRTSLEYYIYTLPWRGKSAAFAEAEQNDPPKDAADEPDPDLAQP